MLGSALAQYWIGQGIRVERTTRRRSPVTDERFLDLSEDSHSIQNDLSETSVVVLSAAITSLASCESNPATAFKINVTNTIRLARQVIDAGGHVVFLSSNQVFDGATPFRRSEEPRCPQSIYGQHKAAVEEALQSIVQHSATIIRLTKVLDYRHGHPARWMSCVRSNVAFDAPEDVMLAPVSSSSLIPMIATLAHTRTPGIHHFSGAEDISYFEAARIFCSQLNAQKLVARCKTEAAGNASTRRHTTLECKSTQQLGFIPPRPEEVLAGIARDAIAAILVSQPVKSERNSPWTIM
jgi:dTDP-4-dehydrorhamnose reductase